MTQRDLDALASLLVAFIDLLNGYPEDELASTPADLVHQAKSVIEQYGYDVSEIPELV